jgi:hypothetical protein
MEKAMAVIDITMASKYVKSWGIWEALREFVQNSFDAADRECPMKIWFEKDSGSRGSRFPGLYIKNEGANITVKELLVGETDKDEDANQRGQHGEGLTLALLVFARQGIPVRIYTNSEVWTASIRFSKVFGTDILSVTTTKREVEDSSLTVWVGISEEQWNKYKLGFIPFIDDIETIDTSNGILILNREYQGAIFCKGIRVQRKETFTYGFDLPGLTLDRDRRMTDEFNLKWHASQVLQSVVTKDSDRGRRLVYDLLQRGAPETEYFNYPTSTVTKYIRDEFEVREGEEAIIVESPDEVVLAQKLKKKPVMAKPKFAEVLRKSGMPHVRELVEKSDRSPANVIDIEDLYPNERHSYEYAIHKVTLKFRRLVQMSEDEFRLLGISPEWKSKDLITALLELRVEVSEFNSEEVLFSPQKEDGILYISRKILRSPAIATRYFVTSIAAYLASKLRNDSLASDLSDVWVIAMFA